MEEEHVIQMVESKSYVPINQRYSTSLIYPHAIVFFFLFLVIHEKPIQIKYV